MIKKTKVKENKIGIEVLIIQGKVKHNQRMGQRKSKGGPIKTAKGGATWDLLGLCSETGLVQTYFHNFVLG